MIQMIMNAISNEKNLLYLNLLYLLYLLLLCVKSSYVNLLILWNNNNKNATYCSVNLTTMNLSNVNNSLCIPFSLVTDSSVINVLDLRANILQSRVDMYNLSSCFNLKNLRVKVCL